MLDRLFDMLGVVVLLLVGLTAIAMGIAHLGKLMFG